MLRRALFQFGAMLPRGERGQVDTGLGKSVSLGTVTLKVHAGDTVSKGQVLAVIDSPDLTAKLSQEEATAASLRIDWQRATLDAEQKLLQLRDAFNQAQVDQKTAQRELDRSRKAYELGSYTELQALKAQDSLEKAQFAFEQAKMNYESQPRQNHFDIDSKKALFDRQQYLVADLKRQVDGLNVRSPVDGQVGQVQVADRASVAKDAPLLTVVDLSALEVEIKVTESLARDLRPGMSADLEEAGFANLADWLTLAVPAAILAGEKIPERPEPPALSKRRPQRIRWRRR